MNEFLDSITICGLRKLADPAGHTHVISLIDPDWPEPETFSAFPADRWLLLRFYDDIEPRGDRVLPTREHVSQILEFGQRAAEFENGKLFIHCLSGKSRSTAAAAMICAQCEPGLDETVIVDHLTRLRPEAWPNSLMMQYADELLGRDGRLIHATRELYRRKLVEDPQWEHSLRRMGREAEVIR